MTKNSFAAEENFKDVWPKTATGELSELTTSTELILPRDSSILHIKKHNNVLYYYDSPAPDYRVDVC